MENALTGLLEQIQREGIEKAQTEAQKIIADAQQKAQILVKEAQEQAAKTLQQANLEVQRLEQASKAALVQAGRDLLLSVQKRLTQMVDSIINQAVTERLTPELTEQLIVEAVKNWKPDAVRIEVPAQDLSRLENALKQKLKEVVSQGVELRPLSTVQKGFRLGVKDGSLFYDFTSSAIAGVLSEMVSAQLSEVLKKAAE